ncbi:MAG: hypothetical protein CMB55_07480 [Euryarchaeota archaeon]|jgi:Ca2+-binding EF-hand superfamily protein|nr:hypothetical protein [Euryarchaeota archaeon]|tara:strand:+ start:65 stop:316 length:252 start_codon:yes stop_codon:yes gene_type:complete
MATKEALVKLRDLMKDSGKSVEDLFKEIDTDGDGTINGPELYKGIKNLVGDALSPSQISLIITALDTNGDNRIDALELRNALS